jgi:hypothetical protein
MSHAVELVGFDVKFRQLSVLLDSFEFHLKAENATLKTWSADQRAILNLMSNIFDAFYNSVSELAARVRDD